jgi:hypothetical protein
MYVQTRKIKPTRRSVSGIFAFRSSESIPFESTLERDFLIRTEFNPSVSKIVAQPTRIPFVSSNGRTYTYTPDFLVYCDGQKTLLVEVKPKEELDTKWSLLKPKFKYAHRYAKERGWLFNIYHENRIRDEKLKNIQFLQQRFKRLDFDLDLVNLFISFLDKSERMTICDARTIFNGEDFHKPIDDKHILHLLSVRTFECDMNHPIDENTIIWAR